MSKVVAVSFQFMLRAYGYSVQNELYMTRIKGSAEEHRFKMIPDFPNCKYKSDLSINSRCRRATS